MTVQDLWSGDLWTHLHAKRDDGDEHLEDQSQRQLPQSRVEAGARGTVSQGVPHSGFWRVGQLEFVKMEMMLEEAIFILMTTY